MVDIFKIVLVSVFGLFLLVVTILLYRYMNRPSLVSMNKDNMTDSEKTVLSQFCQEMRKYNQQHHLPEKEKGAK